MKDQGGKRAAAGKIGCHPTYLVHLLGSEKRRVGLDIAFAIERATDGFIRAEEWVSKTGTEG